MPQCPHRQVQVLRALSGKLVEGHPFSNGGRASPRRRAGCENPGAGVLNAWRARPVHAVRLTWACKSASRYPAVAQKSLPREGQVGHGAVWPSWQQKAGAPNSLRGHHGLAPALGTVSAQLKPPRDPRSCPTFLLLGQRMCQQNPALPARRGQGAQALESALLVPTPARTPNPQNGDHWEDEMRARGQIWRRDQAPFFLSF